MKQTHKVLLCLFAFIVFITIVFMCSKVTSLEFLMNNSTKSNKKEGYTTLGYSLLQEYNQNNLNQEHSMIDTNILLSDSYPVKANPNQLNMKDQSQKWWHYPTFKLGSYEQITNNIRYPNNPDIATCTRDEFCGALYHESSHTKSNISVELPPVPICTDNKSRVNYYNTDNNMLPFTSNLANILY